MFPRPRVVRHIRAPRPTTRTGWQCLSQNVICAIESTIDVQFCQFRRGVEEQHWFDTALEPSHIGQNKNGARLAPPPWTLHIEPCSRYVACLASVLDHNTHAELPQHGPRNATFVSGLLRHWPRCGWCGFDVTMQRSSTPQSRRGKWRCRLLLRQLSYGAYDDSDYDDSVEGHEGLYKRDGRLRKVSLLLANLSSFLPLHNFQFHRHVLQPRWLRSAAAR